MFEQDIPELHRGWTCLLAAATFSLSAGSVTGVVGPNGAGKSTLLRAFAGLAAERVMLLRDGRKLERRAIGFLPQAFEVRSALGVMDCALLGRREQLGWRVPPAAVSKAQRMLDRFGLTSLAARGMHTLSGGQQQRVLLVQRLLRNPELLVLDEPTSALDLHHQLGALATMRDHARNSGAAVLAALPDLTLAARFCDRVIVLAQGRIICEDVPETALAPELIEKHWSIAPEFLRDRDERLVVVPHALELPAGAWRD